MCPPIGVASQPSTPLQIYDEKTSGTGTVPGEKTAGGATGVMGTGRQANVTESHDAGSGAGAVGTDSSATLTTPWNLPTGPGEISASTQRLVDMAIAETKDGPAASFMVKVLIKQEGEQREQNMQDMVAARQEALNQTLAAAEQLKKSGQDLEKAATTGFALNMAGSAAGFASKKSATGDEMRPKIAAAGRSFSAGGEYAGTQGQVTSKNDEAQQKVDEAMAEQANMVADRKKDAIDKIDDLARQAIDFLHDFQETNSDMMAAITRG